MTRRKILGTAIAGILILGGLALGSGCTASRAVLKVGDEAPSFQLVSSQDKLVDYYRDYYGKHHLIVTFYPAAFTPV